LVDKRIGAYQQDLLLKQYDEIQGIYKQIRGWRHDYHNHIQTMKALLALGKIQEHDAYLSQLDDDLSHIDFIYKTGNVMVDAILGSKMSLARAKDISINVKATVPKTMKVSDIDLCVLLGNLMDNAIEACQKCPKEEQFIRLFIGRHKEMLYISVSNASPAVKRSFSGFLSTKRSQSYGFGLMRIDRIAAKYSGFVNRQYEEGVFATEIMLPLNDSTPQ
jgi:sensor histidine kinase regulating citrate/malate metabolism